MYLLEMKHVRKSFGDVEVLKDIDEYLERKTENIREEVKYLNEYLDKQRESEEYKDLTDEEFRKTYDWKYEELNHNLEKISMINVVRTEMIKLAK